MSIKLRYTRTEKKDKNGNIKSIEVSQNERRIFKAYDDDKINPATEIPVTKEETRTVQAFKDTCDINCILARAKKVGVIDHVVQYQPEYGVISAMDFETAFNTVKEAKQMFAELPAQVRANFQNNVENFLAFMEDPENRNVERLLSTSSSRAGTKDGKVAEPDPAPTEPTEGNQAGT